jgi:hypothetical protein
MHRNNSYLSPVLYGECMAWLKCLVDIFFIFVLNSKLIIRQVISMVSQLGQDRVRIACQERGHHAQPGKHRESSPLCRCDSAHSLARRLSP